MTEKITIKSDVCLENIKSWGIITATDPMGYHYSDEENAKRRDELKKYLLDSHFLFWPIEGSSEEKEEKFFFVLNPSEDDMKYFANIFGQKSFVFGYLHQEEDGIQVSDVNSWKTTADETERWKFRVQNYRGKRDKRRDLIRFDYVKEGGAFDEKTSSIFYNIGSSRFGITEENFCKILERAAAYLEKVFEGKERRMIERGLIETTIEANKWAAKHKWLTRGFLYSRCMLEETKKQGGNNDPKR